VLVDCKLARNQGVLLGPGSRAEGVAGGKSGGGAINPDRRSAAQVGHREVGAVHGAERSTDHSEQARVNPGPEERSSIA
jgi:hypothetical protein